MVMDNSGEFAVLDLVDEAAGAVAPAKRCKFGLSTDVIEALLDKLASDDEFRALFARDPARALSSIGHETPALARGVLGLDPVLCLEVKTLASKESIRAASMRLRRDLSIFGPFQCPELQQS